MITMKEQTATVQKRNNDKVFFINDVEGLGETPVFKVNKAFTNATAADAVNLLKAATITVCKPTGKGVVNFQLAVNAGEKGMRSVGFLNNTGLLDEESSKSKVTRALATVRKVLKDVTEDNIGDPSLLLTQDEGDDILASLRESGS